MLASDLALLAGRHTGRGRSEAMDADWYVAEHIIRERIANAAARATVFAMLRESAPRRRGVARRFTDLGRSLVEAARKAALELPRALRDWRRCA